MSKLSEDVIPLNNMVIFKIPKKAGRRIELSKEQELALAKDTAYVEVLKTPENIKDISVGDGIRFQGDITAYMVLPEKVFEKTESGEEVEYDVATVNYGFITVIKKGYYIK